MRRIFIAGDEYFFWELWGFTVEPYSLQMTQRMSLGVRIGGALGSLLGPGIGTAIGVFLGSQGGATLAGMLYDAVFGKKTKVNTKTRQDLVAVKLEMRRQNFPRNIILSN